MQRGFAITTKSFAVYIGRFQPFHCGHLHVVNTALANTDDLIIVLGSSYGPRTIKNPFTEVEREDMIRACLSEADNLRTHFVAVEDSVYNENAWTMDIVSKVSAISKNAQVTLVGHTKDDSSYYLRNFPQWACREVAPYEIDAMTDAVLSSTPIRDGYFRDIYAACVQWHSAMPYSVWQFLDDFAQTEGYQVLRRERLFIDGYKKSWEAAPYPPTFVAVDAVVVQQGHILLIERKDEPGKGLWALPGGFLDPGERLDAAMIRELREETKLKVPEPVLRGHIVTSRVFDAPDRSLRGRMLTNAYLIHLPPHGDGLPAVKAGSDAKVAKWWPINEVKRSMMFDDHMDIIRFFVSQI